MKPFIIYTYDYSIGSGGIKVMHKLCDLLNKNGFESYLTPVGFDKGYYKISSDDIITHLNKIGQKNIVRNNLIHFDLFEICFDLFYDASFNYLNPFSFDF